MSIYVWTSEIKNVYVWTTPVKRVYVGTSLVRPIPYTPNSNTLLYLPFDWDLSNSQWKSITWTWISYESIGIKKSVKLTDVSWYITWPWNLMSSVWTWDFTVSFWVKPTNWGNAMVFGNWYEANPYPSVDILFLFGTAFWQTNKVINLFQTSSWVHQLISSTSSATSLVWNWHHIVSVRRSWVVYFYIDNVLQWQYSRWTSLSNSNYLRILNRPWWQNWTNTWALMDELIVENKWWTDTDISNYYSVAQQFYTS